VDAVLTPAEFNNLFNLLENVAGELIAHMLERLGRRYGQWRADRVRGGPEDVTPISARVAKEVLAAAAREHEEITADEWTSAFLRLREAIVAAREDDMDPALTSGLRPDRLAEILFSHGARVSDALPATAGAERAYAWLVEAISPRIIEEFERRPDFDTQLARATLQQVVLVRSALDVLIETIRNASSVVERGRDLSRDTRFAQLEAPPFERRYLDFIAQSFGRFELFGVNRGREPSKQSFSESYISLTVARTSDPDQSAENEDEELTGAGVAVATALSGRKRVIVRGSAGSGKTTLLGWLAANGAAGRLTGESGPWGEVVPFLVRLRDFTARTLPKVEELASFAASAIDGERPPGWASGCFATGRALLLIDGVDELAAERRGEVQAWIEGLVDAYPDARYVVTVRPSVRRADQVAGSHAVRLRRLRPVAVESQGNPGLHQLLARGGQARPGRGQARMARRVPGRARRADAGAAAGVAAPGDQPAALRAALRPVSGPRYGAAAGSQEPARRGA
jgi:hypothetical protein